MQHVVFLFVIIIFYGLRILGRMFIPGRGLFFVLWDVVLEDVSDFWLSLVSLKSKLDLPESHRDLAHQEMP